MPAHPRRLVAGTPFTETLPDVTTVKVSRRRPGRQRAVSVARPHGEGVGHPGRKRRRDRGAGGALPGEDLLREGREHLAVRVDAQLVARLVAVLVHRRAPSGGSRHWRRVAAGSPPAAALPADGSPTRAAPRRSPFSATVMIRPFASTGDASARPAIERSPSSAPLPASRRLTRGPSDEAAARSDVPASVPNAAGVGQTKYLGTSFGSVEHDTPERHLPGDRARARVERHHRLARQVLVGQRRRRRCRSCRRAASRCITFPPAAANEETARWRSSRVPVRSAIRRRQADRPARHRQPRRRVDGVHAIAVVAAGQVDAPAGDERRGEVDDAVGLIVPARGARRGVEGEDVPAVAPHHHEAAPHRRRAVPGLVDHRRALPDDGPGRAVEPHHPVLRKPGREARCRSPAAPATTSSSPRGHRPEQASRRRARTPSACSPPSARTGARARSPASPAPRCRPSSLQTSLPVSARERRSPSRRDRRSTAYPSATTGLESARAVVPGANVQRPSANVAPERSTDSRLRAASSPEVAQSSARARRRARAASAPASSGGGDGAESVEEGTHD